jgi:hypothetical protein
MAAHITGPVGLRHRTTNVANKTVDQRVLIDLLSRIFQKCGGKQEVWTTPIAPGADGSCPTELANAIWDFQTVWNKRGVLSGVDGVVDPGGHALRHMDALTHGVCGPKIDEAFKKALEKIQTDFRRTWTPSQKDAACTRILIPLTPVRPGTKPPTFKEIVSNPTKLLTLVGVTPDVNGWDMLPLFQGNSAWLRSHTVLGAGCAIPSSNNPHAPAIDPAHEDPCTCSDTVEIGGKCWLNGTVNYGTFGIMVKLCAEEFMPSVLQGLLLTYAKTLVRGYKAFLNKEDATLPLAWMSATFNTGPSGVPTESGNRPNCSCGCGLKGDIVKWDYVWEPTKLRTHATKPHIH